LWVKGSGSDLATMKETEFTGLRLAEVLPLMKRESMSDEEMVTYLSKCQLEPGMPRSSIETLLHAFIPYPHVDHTHPDATNMICCAANGEQLARECFGDEAVWIPYIRPGFTLAKQVGEAVRQNPNVKLVLLAKHGLVTWGQDHAESYHNAIGAINRAAEFVAERSRGRPPFGGQAVTPIPPEQREDVLAAILPVLRGAVSQPQSKILVVDTSEDVMEFVCGKDSRELSQVGAACPDHLVHTKMRPLWIDFDPERDSIEDLKQKVRAGTAQYRDAYEAYFRRNRSGRPSTGNAGGPSAGDARGPGEQMTDPNPRVVLISGLGMIGVGKDLKAAGLSRDLYHRAIAVMRGASSLDSFVSLTEEESYGVEYWPLELYKLSLGPPPKELAGKVAVVTGGAGGIGQAVCQSLAAAGACVVVTDLDEAGAIDVAEELKRGARAVGMDVTQETDVIGAFRKSVLAFGGIDVVVSNAGLASSAPIEETSVELWDRNHAVLAKGYFLVAREAFRIMKEQGIGGNIIFVASKNAMAASKNTSAYSSAKAAELHLARCLADEGGGCGIRVNTVNPDAVLHGSKIWSSAWREQRAEAYGIAPEDLEEYYQQRTTLKVNVFPQDVAEAVLFFSSPRSAKSTGNILNVDGGVAGAFPR
jgi:rhamnulose-1-phosphate aldolase/alcohol dehydrogenase